MLRAWWKKPVKKFEGECVHEKGYPKMNTKFKIGDKVTYQDVDMESYSRGYGISYKLSNGETVEEKKLVKVDTVKTETSPTKG